MYNEQKIKMDDNMNENVTIRIEDKLSRLEDRVSASDKRPKGRVNIFERKDDGSLPKIEDTSNLIVYNGREWLAQRAVNQAFIGQPTTNPQNYINWFGLGTGGAGANLLIPIVPTAADYQLNQQVVINSADSELAYGGRLHPFDSIEFLEDTANNNRILIVSISTTISKTEANGPNNGSGPTDYYDLNEAGLYTSNSNDPNVFILSTLKLFARVTFSTIRKNVNRSLVFVWYIYF
jgi:hypothetical protein